MWNVMNTWMILENNNFFLLLPQQNAPFSLFTENCSNTTTVDYG